MIFDPRIPEVVQPLIKNYLLLTEKHVLGLINTSYIIGSVALEEFNKRFSDIDFISLLNHKASVEEIEHLRQLHQIIEDSYRWKLSGSYILFRDLGKLVEHVEPHLHFHDGVLDLASKKGLNWITWWELKNYGIPILGPEPQNLPFTVNWDVLLAEMRENLNSYWLNWTRRPQRILLMDSDWGIQWSVLGVLRQFYMIRENSITTKVKAARYALDHLPQKWYPLIQVAINIRQGIKNSFYRFKFGRMMEAVHFLKYIIHTCNEYSNP